MHHVLCLKFQSLTQRLPHFDGKMFDVQHRHSHKAAIAAFSHYLYVKFSISITYLLS